MENLTPDNPTPNILPPTGMGMTLVQMSASVSGPLPSPETLAGYERALPGSAERIISMAERQAKHRQECERLRIQAPIQDAKAGRAEARLGQIFALIIGVSGFAAACVIIFLCPSAAGATTASIVGGTTVLGMVTAFILGQKYKQLADKQPEKEKAPK